MLNNLTLQVFIAATLGVLLALGYQLIEPNGIVMVDNTISLLKSGFLALLKMLIAPMIFFSLIGGIISIGNVVRLRQLGGITVGYYLLTTGLAITLALIAVVFVHPWTAYPPIVASMADASGTRLLEPGSDSILAVLETMASLAFTNPFSALVNLNILGIVTNALFMGVAMVLVLEENSPLFRLVVDANKIIIQVLRWVIRVLPIGIFAILFDFTVRLSGDDGLGGTFLTQLFQFGLLVVTMTLIHGLIVLPAIAWITTRTSPLKLLQKISSPLLVAFSTSSSAATLPVSMRAAEDNLEVSPSVASFVLPLGATMNMDGTALFEAVAAVFLAYLYGIELSGVMVVTVFLMAMVASIGAPGMPSASMSGMQMVMLAIGIPLEAIAILLVIERPLDTIRTSVNVEGDLIGSLIVDRYLKR
ncbi:MAG: dicarboxylate/amino acid:cation symporter [Gammaproteobacteria bacterium]|nr:dicarboxylate/amino acid:cation symporter [Gammaproteobacteria bacterium]MDG1232922.1 dicarboxylate/amino acid:cation symporter [Pseudomonadales bacterium]MBT5154845.1 dicarboxylate/amino acid:cation symporter [Gammaproteobacteria bacterium]MBT5686741.1 dicarboxylate/amino acid:cation symporter [Gammaproteobacteria bacterium]MBT5726084.1 dicarboxylate/amino acid:cation symporter [Gammaproteobacteria bacterium]